GNDTSHRTLRHLPLFNLAAVVFGRKAENRSAALWKKYRELRRPGDPVDSHAVFDLKYHVIWCTKYRYKILRGRVAERARDLIRQICESRAIVIVRGAVSPDHVHLLLSATVGAVDEA